MPSISSIVRVRDYVSNPGNVDDSPGMLGAWLDYINGYNAGMSGVLDFGTGHYRISKPLVFTNAANPNAGFSGRIMGDNAQSCTIHVDAGVGRGLQLNDFAMGQMAGIGLVGPSEGQHAGGGDTGYGLVFASSHQDLGSAVVTLENLSASGFARGFMFGDDQAPLGAAAEFVCTNLTANFNTIGYDFNEFNTMDFVFVRPSAVHNGTTMRCTFQGVTQVFVTGGGGSLNDCEFNFGGNSGVIDINGYRSEGGSPVEASSPAVIIGGGSGDHITIRNSTFRATTTYPTASVYIDNGAGLVTLEHNTLVGPVRHIQGWHWLKMEANSIFVQGTDRFIDTDPNTPIGAVHMMSEGNYQPQIIQAGWVGAMHPSFSWRDLQGPDLRAGNYTGSGGAPSTMKNLADVQAATWMSREQSAPDTRSKMYTTWLEHKRGFTGPRGIPVTPEVPVDEGGTAQGFSSGVVVWSTLTGTKVI